MREILKNYWRRNTGYERRYHTINYESTIKKVCEKNGHKKLQCVAYKACFCEEMMTNEGEFPSLSEWNYYTLYGFLTEESTLKAVFGEEYTEWHVEYRRMRASDAHLQKSGHIKSFNYHRNQMGNTLDSVLKYYEGWFKNSEFFREYWKEVD
jgi:hypothetical protein